MLCFGLSHLIRFYSGRTQRYGRTCSPAGTAAGPVGDPVVLEESLRGAAEGGRIRQKAEEEVTRRWIQNEGDGSVSGRISSRKRRRCHRAGRPERMDGQSSEDKDRLQHDSSVHQLHVHRSGCLQVSEQNQTLQDI